MATKKGKKAARTKTPITDGFMEKIDDPMPPGAKPTVVGATWKNGFGMAYGGPARTSRLAIAHLKHTPAIVIDGVEYKYGVQKRKYSEDCKTLLGVGKTVHFKTEAESSACYTREVRLQFNKEAKEKAAFMKLVGSPMTPQAQEEAIARQKVMRAQYPDTFRALAAVSQTKLGDRPGAMESVFWALLKDLVRLYKPKTHREFCAIAISDRGRITELAKAFNEASPGNKVDAAIVARWAERYSKMTPKELARALNEEHGFGMKPDAVKKRAQRMGLTSSRPVGAPEKSSNWDK